MADMGLADLALGADPRRPQVGHDGLDHPFAVALPAVHLDAAEPAGSELVDVQDDDVVPVSRASSRVMTAAADT